ncbi:copper resistance CopC family protein [Nocardioides sp.]|uniref:copper resistance CopC family protein n=1 Tax=Nocardioides sp. TaxID=35761 RepID=UPI002B27BCAC|nr:copper resistance protein CopC [Nocardioides sp.]
MRRLLLTRSGAVLATLTTVAFVLLVLVPGPALAHGDLVDGSPGPGDDVAVGTDVLRLEFTDLDPDGRPLVAVRDAAGDPVAVGTASFGDDATICARSAPLEPGVTTIDYAVLSEDGDRQEGSYTFEVSEGGALAQAGVCDAVDLAAPGEPKTLDEMGSGTVPTPVLYGLGLLAVVAMGLAVLRVRSDRRAHPA